jgi:hypothetical protein
MRQVVARGCPDVLPSDKQWTLQREAADALVLLAQSRLFVVPLECPLPISRFADLFPHSSPTAKPVILLHSSGTGACFDDRPCAQAAASDTASDS